MTNDDYDNDNNEKTQYLMIVS